MRKQILIADDEPMVLRLLRISLERAGYAVRVACDGKQALDEIGKLAPDALITDIDMPRVSGEELVRELTREPEMHGFPIYVLTSKTALDHREWSRSVDGLVFLEKPVSMRFLLASLDAYFAHDHDTVKSAS